MPSSRVAGRTGDRLTIQLPLALRIEATRDDPDTIAILRGPLVLAADLGPGESDLTQFAPVLVGQDVLVRVHRRVITGSLPRARGHGKTARARLRAVLLACTTNARAVYFRRFTEDALES